MKHSSSRDVKEQVLALISHSILSYPHGLGSGKALHSSVKQSNQWNPLHAVMWRRLIPCYLTYSCHTTYDDIWFCFTQCVVKFERQNDMIWSISAEILKQQSRYTFNGMQLCANFEYIYIRTHYKFIYLSNTSIYRHCQETREDNGKLFCIYGQNLETVIQICSAVTDHSISQRNQFCSHVSWKVCLCRLAECFTDFACCCKWS